jgi:hypothetical protein
MRVGRLVSELVDDMVMVDGGWWIGYGRCQVVQPSLVGGGGDSGDLKADPQYNGMWDRTCWLQELHALGHGPVLVYKCFSMPALDSMVGDRG